VAVTGIMYPLQLVISRDPPPLVQPSPTLLR
jgi:hypothetical protein